MRRNRIERIMIFTILLLLMVYPYSIHSSYNTAAAEHRSYKVETIHESVTIPPEQLAVKNIEFTKGTELEVIYTVAVSNDQPVDIWFLNEDNYLLLRGGAQFLYYLDGSQSGVSYAKKVVNLQKYGSYKLVITNYYSNQSVDVDITYDLRAYYEEQNDNGNDLLWSSIMSYIFLSIIVILVILAMILTLKLRGYHKLRDRSLKQRRPGDRRINKIKVEKSRIKNSAEGNSKRNKKSKKRSLDKAAAKNAEPNKSNNKHNYCGNCGEAVDSAYCRRCGSKA